MPVNHSTPRYFATRLGLIACSLVLLSSAAFLPAAERPEAPAPKASQETSPDKLWEGRFTQCSFNAVSSALIYYYGPTGKVDDRDKFEQSVFRDPVSAAGFGGYFGWGPWTSYMVESGKMVWNGKPVTGIKAERFSLRTTQQPELKNRLILVHYAPGEREQLCAKLMEKLAEGPVVMWTPYAGAQDGPFFAPWHHVSRIEPEVDAVPFGPFTHSVTLFAVHDKDGHIEPDRVLVTDCSVRKGVFTTDPATIVSTSAAMTTFVRLKSPGEKSILERGLKGVTDDQYNVLFTKAPTTQPAAGDK
ncbi:MAG TPA: hypothetical protein VFE47_15295 [Tepidisphaeraceae bacterium]|jgi:hypothetical protein|nr:hypothetical protein [Tepidisphaeraceae bacterium]